MFRIITLNNGKYFVFGPIFGRTLEIGYCRMPEKSLLDIYLSIIKENPNTDIHFAPFSMRMTFKGTPVLMPQTEVPLLLTKKIEKDDEKTDPNIQVPISTNTPIIQMPIDGTGINHKHKIGDWVMVQGNVSGVFSYRKLHKDKDGLFVYSPWLPHLNGKVSDKQYVNWDSNNDCFILRDLPKIDNQTVKTSSIQSSKNVSTSKKEDDHEIVEETYQLSDNTTTDQKLDKVDGQKAITFNFQSKSNTTSAKTLPTPPVGSSKLTPAEIEFNKYNCLALRSWTEKSDDAEENTIGYNYTFRVGKPILIRAKRGDYHHMTVHQDDDGWYVIHPYTFKHIEVFYHAERAAWVIEDIF